VLNRIFSLSLANAFGKKADNLKTAVAMYFGHYNFIRILGTFRASRSAKAGVDNRMRSIGNLAGSAILIRKHPNCPVC
jgi:hypothetical protein